jgi:hypothetical protein
MLSMHKLLAGDGYTYLTSQVAAGETGLAAGEPLVAYYEATGTPPGRWTGTGLAGLGRDGDGHRVGRIRVGDVVDETIRVTGKGDDHQLMPLPVEVGEALAAYLRGDRPRTSVDPRVSFTAVVPYRPLDRNVCWAHYRRRGVA